MPRIAVVTSHPPFTAGGHLVIAHQLVAALRVAGHDVDLVLTPQNRFGRQGAAYLATWLTDVGESDGKRVDQVISLRFPAYAIRHPRHVCWLLHTMREYYDLWPEFRSRLSWKGRLKEGLRRRLIRAADRRLLGPRRLQRLFVLSETVNDRLRNGLGIEGETLYPPPPVRPYRCDGYGNYLLVVSRLTPHKRVDLLIRALADPAAAGIRAVIAGDGECRDDLRQLAGALGVLARITFLGQISDDDLVAHYARCRAVCFTPLREDFGFVTTEAFASAKPVVACADSGGPAEVVEHDVNGLLTKPTPTSLAMALATVMNEAGVAERLGAAAARKAASMSWASAVSRLVLV